MKKKGFTLIELLAVIVILAILALILTPMIQTLVLNARKSAFERSIDGILAAAEYYQLENPSDGTIIFECDGSSCKDSNGHELTFKGEVPTSGTVTISENGVEAENLCNQSFCGSGSKSALVVDTGGVPSPSKSSWTYDYLDETHSERYHVFQAPNDGYYRIETWGASGGGATDAIGGKGGYARGTIYLTAGEIVYIYVGGQGQSSERAVIGSTAGGYNGGGNSYISRTECSQENASGGGATDIRLVSGTWDNSDSLVSRIMVAGGGGGAQYEYCRSVDFATVTGGDAGGLTGNAGTYITAGGFSALNPTGGTQTSGGQSVFDWQSSSYTSTAIGGFGFGATNTDTTRSSSGGGSGYYGGASGGWQPGAGGSSYVSGHTGSVAITSATNTTPKSGCANGTTNIECSYHYSGKTFIYTKMLSGNEIMPSHDGKSTMTGNEGNGYAKISYVGSEYTSVTFDSTVGSEGQIEKFTAPKSGTYILEVWGAQGGNASAAGGKGGYSKGEVDLVKDEIIYVVVGGAGVKSTGEFKPGGYNGGGDRTSSWGDCGSGGGATHIAKETGLLKDLASNTASVLIVAGGGGGAQAGITGGFGGGVSGGNNSYKSGTVGTQTSGNAFGYGDSLTGGGAGGGWYGGKNLAGGSGYIGGVTRGTTVAGNATMPTHDGTSTMTGNAGDGYAKITYIR